MSMLEWAREEVRIASERERCGTSNDEWNYGIACYESALKAFESLLNDEHSGMSISITKSILNRLIDGKSLTPIEDIPEVWDHTSGGPYADCKQYQCKRYSPLFKYVYDDGHVEYRDTEYCHIVNDDDPKGIAWHNGFVSREICKLFPITFPYYPRKSIKVVVHEDLYDGVNGGDYDTMGILYCIKDGEKIDINKYYKETDNLWKEISEEEYNKRCDLCISKLC